MKNRTANSLFIPLHLIFWCGVWLFYIYFFDHNLPNTIYVTWSASFLLPIAMLATYITNYHLLPKYLFRKKYATFIIQSLLLLAFSAYLVQLIIFDNFLFGSSENTSSNQENFVFVLVMVYLVVGFVGFAKLLSYNAKTVAANQSLANENLENSLKLKEQELQYLKKQIHPHFLFNTLNTIYSFALRKSDETPGIIIKLSNLLDYILYQVQKPSVLLTEEIAHLKEYVSLEKIRFDDVLAIEFNTEGVKDNLQIPPMLFIPLVENAFKHGRIVDGVLAVSIAIKVTENSISCTVRNSIKELELEESPGLGLATLERRLTLLYKDQFKLENKITPSLYTVRLDIHNLSIYHEATI